jgi:hypothetical protein
VKPKQKKQATVRIYQTVVGDSKRKTKVSTHRIKIDKDLFDEWGKGFSVKTEPKWDELHDRLVEIATMCRKSAEIGAATKEDHIRERLTTKLLETAVYLDKLTTGIALCVQFKVPKGGETNAKRNP